MRIVVFKAAMIALVGALVSVPAPRAAAQGLFQPVIKVNEQAVTRFEIEQRARMLTLLGQTQVRLLTNNPAKVAGLGAAGVAVTERVAHQLPPTPHNAAYLATTRDRTGHRL